MPWSSAKDDGKASRNTKLVGSVIDPSVDNDGLGLTGPGAPLSPKRGPFGGKETEHPVRARLLERARRAREGLPPDETPLSPKIGPLIDDSHEDSVRLLTPGPSHVVDDSPLTDDEPFEAPVPSVALRASEAQKNDSAEQSDNPLDDTLPHPRPGGGLPSPAPSADPPPPLDAGSPLAEVAAPTNQSAVPLPHSAPPHPDQANLALPKPSTPPPPSPPPSSSPPVALPSPRLKITDATENSAGDPPPPARTPHPGAVATELDQFARRAVRSDVGPRLSPNMTAAIGGLLGITVVVSLGIFMSSTSTKTPIATVEKDAVEEKAAVKAPEVKKPERAKMPGPWRIRDDANKAGHKVLSGRIGKLAFLTAIQEAGLPKSEAYRAYGALKGELDLDHCSSKDTFLALVSGSDKNLVAFEYIKSKEQVYQVKANDQGRLEGKQLDLKVTRNQIRRSFVHDGKSFEDSARKSGFDPGIANLAEEALRGHSTLADFKRGDQVKIIAQEVTVLGEFSRYAGIEAMEIARAGEETRRIYYYAHPVEGGYFDKNGRAPYEGGWRKPITDAPRTSKFNPKRLHPVLKRVLPHNGTDYGAPSGTPIGATAPGKVTFMGMAGRSGNLVKVEHTGGYESGYAHMSRFAENLKVGDHVERMQLVGYVGNTGSSTAPHLHFSIKKDGAFIDPESLNLDGLRVLPKDHRPEFELVRQKYDPILDQVPAPPPLPNDTTAVAASNATSGAEESSEGGESDEAYEDDESGDPGDSPDELAASTPAPASVGPAPDKGAPAQAVRPSSLFLSDAELLKMQAVTDDGEVRE